jgi:hypothetical protein
VICRLNPNRKPPPRNIIAQRPRNTLRARRISEQRNTLR